MIKITAVILLLSMISLSSCFQLLEEVTMKNDGSGEMQITFNLSQSKSKLASIMLLDSVNGHKIPSEKDIEKFMDATVDFLMKSDGISKVTKSVDFKNYIASVSFNFSDVTKINDITKKLLSQQKIKGPDNSYSFDKVAGVLKRTYRYSSTIKDGFDKLKPKDKDIFKGASYTSIFRFQNNIRNTTNQLSKISPSGKATMLTIPALELVNGTTSPANIIQLSK